MGFQEALLAALSPMAEVWGQEAHPQWVCGVREGAPRGGTRDGNRRARVDLLAAAALLSGKRVRPAYDVMGVGI